MFIRKDNFPVLYAMEHQLAVHVALHAHSVFGRGLHIFECPVSISSGDAGAELRVMVSPSEKRLDVPVTCCAIPRRIERHLIHPVVWMVLAKVDEIDAACALWLGVNDFSRAFAVLCE